MSGTKVEPTRDLAVRGNRITTDGERIDRAAKRADWADRASKHAAKDLPHANRLASHDWLPSVVKHSRAELPGNIHAGSIARQTIVEQFGGLLGRDERDVLRLLVTELVNNSVVHGGADAEHHVILDLAVAPERIRAEVRDGGPGLDPDALRMRNDSASGNGLILLDGLASRWGVSAQGGTCVWFELDR
jgi:anti-sigma regulatory factor (Ser/Thr protein kinase)